MNRFFLALMALLAGLTTQVAPAAARVSEGTQIGAAADVRLLERQAADLVAATETARPGHEIGAIPTVFALQAQVAEPHSVRTGIDRARE